MTNLERAAAMAAEAGLPTVGSYRGWDIYRYTDNGEYTAACPHEMDVGQFLQVDAVDGEGEPDMAGGQLCMLAGVYTEAEIQEYINEWEAARAAMPATAFFGVEQESVVL